MCTYLQKEQQFLFFNEIYYTTQLKTLDKKKIDTLAYMQHNFQIT